MTSQGHGLEFLGTEHRSDATPSGVPTLVAEGCKPHEIFPGPPDGGHPDLRLFLSAFRMSNTFFRFLGAQPRQMGCRSELNPVVRYQEIRRLLGRAGNHQRIDSDPLEFQGEKTGRERVGNKTGQRRLGDNRIFGGGGQARSDQRSAGKNERIVG